MSGQVEHPDHYGGKDNPYEAIKVIEAWKLGFNLGNTIKYISRAGSKNPDKHVQDLEKAKWYLEREINNLKDEKDKAQVGNRNTSSYSSDDFARLKHPLSLKNNKSFPGPY